MRRLTILLLLTLLSENLYAEQDLFVILGFKQPVNETSVPRYYLNSKNERSTYQAVLLPEPQTKTSGETLTLRWNNLGVYLSHYPDQTQDDYGFISPTDQNDPQKEAESEVVKLIQQRGIYPQFRMLNQEQRDPLGEYALKVLHRKLKPSLPRPRITRSESGSEGFLLTATPILTLNIEWEFPVKALKAPLELAIAESEAGRKRRAEEEKHRIEQARRIVAEETRKEEERLAVFEARHKEEERRGAEQEKRKAVEAIARAAEAKRQEEERLVLLAKEERQRKEAERRRVKVLEELSEIVIGKKLSGIDTAAMVARLSKNSPQWAARFILPLTIKTNIEQGSVTIDGVSYGKLRFPYTAKLSIGDHSIEIDHPDYEIVSIDYTVLPAEVGKRGDLEVKMYQKSIQFQLDGGEIIGSTITVIGHQRIENYHGDGIELAWGDNYTVIFEKKGYKTHEVQVEVYSPSEIEKNRQKISLHRAPVPFVLHGENLRGSTIAVDGKRVTDTYRGEVLELAWGKSHILNVKQDGYDIYKKKIDVQLSNKKVIP
jgi:hypothetical protein